MNMQSKNIYELIIFFDFEYYFHKEISVIW